jgi:hypothetical protein
MRRIAAAIREIMAHGVWKYSCFKVAFHLFQGLLQYAFRSSTRLAKMKSSAESAFSLEIL